MRIKKKKETIFRRWEKVLILSYRPDVLNVQNFTYLCIIKNKGFKNRTYDGDMNVHYDVLVVRSQNNLQLRSGRRGNNCKFYLSCEAIVYCEKSLCSYLNLMDRNWVI